MKTPKIKSPTYPMFMYRMYARYVEVQMLHVSLGSSFWHWRDIVYWLTGRIL